MKNNPIIISANMVSLLIVEKFPKDTADYDVILSSTWTPPKRQMNGRN